MYLSFVSLTTGVRILVQIEKTLHLTTKKRTKKANFNCFLPAKKRENLVSHKKRSRKSRGGYFFFRSMGGDFASSAFERKRGDFSSITHKTQKEKTDLSFFPYLEASLTSGSFSNSDEFLEALIKNRGKDKSSGRTLIGPHKSDLMVKHSAKNIDAKYCSTGEQKALLVSIILSMSREIVKLFGVPPILLLDEIGAHLDDERRNELILQLFALKAQFFITATDPSFFKYHCDELNYVEIFNKGGHSNIK